MIHNHLKYDDMGYKGLVSLNMPMGVVAKEERYPSMVLAGILRQEHILLCWAAHVDAAHDLHLEQDPNFHVWLHHCAHHQLDTPVLTITDLFSHLRFITLPMMVLVCREANTFPINRQAKHFSPPLIPMVSLLSRHFRLPLLPNSVEPHDSSNTFPEDMHSPAPIKKNRRSPSTYPHVCILRIEIDVVATHGK